MNFLGVDEWAHSGVARLYTRLAEKGMFTTLHACAIVHRFVIGFSIELYTNPGIGCKTS
jgi:hypothetical protein